MTALAALSNATATVPTGAAWTVAFETRDANGNLSALVTPTVLLTAPDTSTSAPLPLSLGYGGGWYVQPVLTLAGRHLMKVSTAEDASYWAAHVDVPLTEAGMPVVGDVSVYLGALSGTWSTAELTDALHAEAAAQRARCGERPVYPDDLRQALLRRTQRNLAMRRFPIAVDVGQDGGGSILPSRDPEVRRLEGPFRRRPIG